MCVCANAKWVCECANDLKSIIIYHYIHSLGVRTQYLWTEKFTKQNSNHEYWRRRLFFNWCCCCYQDDFIETSSFFLSLFSFLFSFIITFFSFNLLLTKWLRGFTCISLCGITSIYAYKIHIYSRILSKGITRYGCIVSYPNI